MLVSYNANWKRKFKLEDLLFIIVIMLDIYNLLHKVYYVLFIYCMYIMYIFVRVLLLNIFFTIT